MVLGDFLTFTKVGLYFAHHHLADALRVVPTSTAAAKPKPKKARGERAATIELLTREMRAHLIGARDHARFTKEQHGVAELLPRPKQYDLAKAIKVSDSTVSRCLRDPEAKLFQRLWRMALNVEDVLRWTSSSPGFRGDT